MPLPGANKKVLPPPQGKDIITDYLMILKGSMY